MNFKSKQIVFLFGYDTIGRIIYAYAPSLINLDGNEVWIEYGNYKYDVRQKNLNHIFKDDNFAVLKLK